VSSDSQCNANVQRSWIDRRFQAVFAAPAGRINRHRCLQKTVQLRATFLVEIKTDPRWAQGGPRHLNHDGSFGGHEVGWPAIQGLAPPAIKGTDKLVRPGSGDLRNDFARETLIFGREDALLKYRRSLRALADRRKARKAEQIRVGLPEADARVEAIGDQVEAIAIAFDDLPPTRANAAAARTIWKS
jgi:hypothetical protein